MAYDNSQVNIHPLSGVEYQHKDCITVSRDEIPEIEELLQRVYNNKKADNLKLSERYYKLSNISEYYAGKAARMENCSNYLAFAKIDNRYKVVRTVSCCVRLCPMCAYKRSLAVYRNVRKIYDYLISCNQHSKFLFITLTIENVVAQQLQTALDSLNRGFQNIVRQKAFKKITLGTLRAIEITYNKSTGKYHPHIHILLHTTSELYAGRNYITQQQLTDMWQSAANTDYRPIVDIRKFKRNTGRELAEVAKYSVKPSDYINSPDSVIMTLDNVLHKRQLITAAGTFREAKKILKIKELEEHEDYSKYLNDLEAELIIYKWHFGEGQYKIAKESLTKLIQITGKLNKLN